MSHFTLKKRDYVILFGSILKKKSKNSYRRKIIPLELSSFDYTSFSWFLILQITKKLLRIKPNGCPQNCSKIGVPVNKFQYLENKYPVDTAYQAKIQARKICDFSLS